MADTPTKQISLRVPESLHRALKAKCAKEGISITAAIVAAIKELLKR